MRVDMKYLIFGDIRIPLTCITGLSYSKSGNIVETSRLSCRCNGIMPLQIQIQMVISPSTCAATDLNFNDFARDLCNVIPDDYEPSYVSIDNDIIVPQLKFMLSSVNSSFQSDRNGILQEVNVSWTLVGTQVVKKENRQTELNTDKADLLPKVMIHCKGKTLDCSQDISISNLQLSGFRGTVELLIGDTYTDVTKDSWLVDLNTEPDSYLEIDGYGKFHIQSVNLIGNWLTCEISKYPRSYYNHITKTFVGRKFTLKDIFPDAEVKSSASFEYLVYDDTPLNMLLSLRDNLGYLIGLRNDTIYLYDTPKSIPAGQVTYDYVLDSDVMTFEFSKVVFRDNFNEYTAGDDSGETYYVQSRCRIDDSNIAERILDYLKFNQNMITLTIPLETRINIGSLINVNVGDKIINCVCTEYDIDFINNMMQIELHYVKR